MCRIRQYRPADPQDCADCYDVCVRTAAAGSDARGTYSTDALMPDVFCGPYLELEPQWAWVVDSAVNSGDRVVGYLIATPDTREFVRRYRTAWLPGFAARYPFPDDADNTDDAAASPDDTASPDSPGSARERALIRLGHHPERMLIAEIDEYPAHLHIDLLPAAQGQGLGRRLIDTLCAELAEAGVPGLHLSMDPTNVGAREFYRRLGFTELASSTPDQPVLGRILRVP